MKIKKLIGVMSLAGLAVPGIAFATNGYFSHGFGVKSQGMAGVGIAFPQDALAAATNPAGMVLVGDRIDFGLTWFRPQRETELQSGTFGPMAGTYDGNDKSNFFIPEFGYNKMINQTMALGVSVYGNGGMNTGYDNLNAKTKGAQCTSAVVNGMFGGSLSACLGSPVGNLGLFGTGKAGVDLSQLFISPTFSMKVNPANAIGISINFAYQQFAADGLQAFDNSMASASPGNVTNRGHDSSTGWGVRVGWIGQITPTVSLGATYQSKTSMSKLSDYQGLFANQGSFDIPENYGIGIAVKATPKLTLAADVEQINYGKIASIANSMDCVMQGTCQMGASNGGGFGWGDMTVYKLGGSYEYSQHLTLRAGFSTTSQPIPSSQTMVDILAPGVVENHLTLGATWTLANKAELSVGYMHAFEKTVNGTGLSQGIDIQMHEDSLGIAYGWKI